MRWRRFRLLNGWSTLTLHPNPSQGDSCSGIFRKFYFLLTLKGTSFHLGHIVTKHLFGNVSGFIHTCVVLWGTLPSIERRFQRRKNSTWASRIRRQVLSKLWFIRINIFTNTCMMYLYHKHVKDWPPMILFWLTEPFLKTKKLEYEISKNGNFCSVQYQTHGDYFKLMASFCYVSLESRL